MFYLIYLMLQNQVPILPISPKNKFKTILLVFVSIMIFYDCKKEVSSTKLQLKKNEVLAKDSTTILLQNSLRKELLEKIKQNSCPGAAIYIIKDGKDFLNIVQGLKASNVKNDFIDSSTLFRIGSLSKGFAGILAAKLVNEGKIKLNDPVQKYIPDFRLKAKQKGDSIRVWHILSHSSGLTEHAFSNLLDQEKDKKTILNALNRVMVRDSTGKAYAYQNACFSMVEEIIKSATGLSYGEAIQKYLFVPLKMKYTNTSYDSLINSKNKALPHRYNGKSNGYIPIPIHKAYYNAPAAGGINSNIIDMKKWLKAVIGLNEKVISKKDRDLAFQKRIYTSWDDKYYNTWEKADSSYYGLGWRSIRLNENNVVFHGGQVNSYRCEIAFNPITKTGVVALFNSPCDLSNTIVPLVFSILE
jgi:beta-lactamase class C